MSDQSAHLDTRQVILKAAKALFSQKGYNGASIADIARQAEVTKSLVMYHWPSKEQLWVDVMNEALEPYMELLVRYGEKDPSVTLEEILRFAVRMHIEHPEIIRMWTWLSLDGQFLIPEDKICRGRTAIDRIVHDSGAQGLHPSFRPLMLISLTMAAIDGWFCYRDMIGHITGMDTRSPESVEEFISTLVGLVLPQAEALVAGIPAERAQAAGH